VLISAIRGYNFKQKKYFPFYNPIKMYNFDNKLFTTKVILFDMIP